MNQLHFSILNRPLYLALLTVPVAFVAFVAIGVVIAFSNYEASYQGRVYPGVSAFGIDLSGLSREDARRLLADQAAQRASRPVSVVYSDQEWRYTAQELGLELDVEPLLERAMAVGRDGWLLQRMASLWELRQNGRSLGTLEPEFNRQPPARALQAIASQIDRPTIDAALAIEPDFLVRVTRSQIGRRVDQEESLRRVLAALDRGADRVSLAVVETPPAVPDEKVAHAADVTRMVLASPLSVQFRDQIWTVSREELRKMLRLERQPDGTLEAVLDRTPLAALANRIAKEIQQAPIDARFAWAGGALEVIKPSRSGISLEPEEAVRAMLAAAKGPKHLVELPVTVVKPAVPMEERHSFGIKELIEQSSTSFKGSVPAKRHNIRLAAQRINGVVVPPNGMFSFNEAVGPTTLEAGFRWGFAIQGGADGPKTIPSVAGGICQVATTLFHSVFWAGYTIEERYPHLYWIPSYTSRDVVGIDTTVDEAAGLDFRFINPTPHHLLVQSWVDNSDRLHFALYGTKPDWKMEVEGPFKTNIRPTDPKPVVEEDPTMPFGERVVVEAARDGFDLLVIRKVTYQGETRTLRLVSHYQPSRNVTLVGTRGRPQPTPTPTGESAPPPSAGGSSTPQAQATPAPASPESSPPPVGEPEASQSSP